MFPSELDGPVERVDMVKEGIQTATIPGPNEEDVHCTTVSPFSTKSRDGTELH